MQYCPLQHWILLSSADTSTTDHHFHFGPAASLFLELLVVVLHSFPVAHWTLSNLGLLIFQCHIFFAILYSSWGSHGKYTWVVCHSLLWWITFCQNSPLWPVCLWWPYMAWLTVSLSYTKLWSVWSYWLVFCYCGFHSFCPLMDEDNRLVQVSWWEGLAVGKTGSCSDGQGHAQ